MDEQISQKDLYALSGAVKAMQFVGEIKKLTGSKPIAYFFEWDGSEVKRVHGSEHVEIETHPDKEATSVTWFSVKEKDDYTFLRFAVIESAVQELLGQVPGEESPDTRYWRWVARPKEGVVVGGNYVAPNVKLQFVVIGYRPKELIDAISS